MKNITVVSIVAVFIMVFTFGIVINREHIVHASMEQGTKIYKSIQLEPGDDLTKIAKRYAPTSGLSEAEYIEKLKQMNQLDHDEVLSGEYIMIMYMK